MENVKGFLQSSNSPRFSVLLGGDWIHGVFGAQMGILLFLCDGQGIVRHVEPYPKLKFPASQDDVASDWQPKLHQAVKKVLDKFFPKGK